MKKLFQKGGAKVAIDEAMLTQQFESIKTFLAEIRNFTQKKVGDNLTVICKRKVDIEQAWPSSGQLLFETYNELCGISEILGVHAESLEESLNFKDSLDLFIQQMIRILMQIRTEMEPPRFSQTELLSINERIQKIQQEIVKLHQHVISDFDYLEKQQHTPEA